MDTPQTPSSHSAPITRRAAFVRGLLSDLAIMTGIGLFLGLLGPFGSAAQPLAVRLVSWLAFAYVGYAFYRPMAPVVDWAEAALALPRAGLWVAAVLIATVPMTAAVLAIGNPGAPLRWPGLEIALTSYFYVGLIGGAVTLVFNMLRARSQAGEAARAGAAPHHAARSEEPKPSLPSSSPPPPPPPPAAPNPLFDALPADLGSDVVALEMEDHYVRVHTALGSHLVLMRLRDAMACVSEIEGRQVHRSWWVARLAVEDVKREGRNVRLVLPHGLEAPVSRAQVSELKAAGWI